MKTKQIRSLLMKLRLLFSIWYAPNWGSFVVFTRLYGAAFPYNQILKNSLSYFFEYEKRNNCSIFLEYFCIWLLRTCHLGPLENDWIQMANEKRQAQTGPEDQRVTATHPFLSPLYLLENQTRRPRIFQPSAKVSFGNHNFSFSTTLLGN